MVACEFCFRSYQQKHECWFNPNYHIKALLRYITNDPDRYRSKNPYGIYEVEQALKFLHQYYHQFEPCNDKHGWLDTNISKVEEY